MYGIRSAVLLLTTVLATAACEISAGGPDQSNETAAGTSAMMASDEAESIARGVRQSVALILESGAQAATDMPEVYTPDAVFSDESEVTHAGRAQIARAFSQGMPPGASIDIRSTGVLGSGDLVVDMGNYTFSMPSPQGGAAANMHGRYLVVLQRMNDGSWKIVRQLTDAVGMGGAMPAAPPAAAPPAGDTSAGD